MYHQLIIIFYNFWVAPVYNFTIIQNKLLWFYLRINGSVIKWLTDSTTSTTSGQTDTTSGQASAASGQKSIASEQKRIANGQASTTSW